MNRTEFERSIEESYGISAEYPFEKYPNFAVFRHVGNKKWFAVVMTIPKSKLGLKEDGDIDIVNLKCEQGLLCSLWQEKGFFPAYHMNKGHWISASLVEGADADFLRYLTDISFNLTLGKKKE